MISFEKYDCANQENVFAQTNQYSTISHNRKNLRMFNIASKCFALFNNTLPASSVAHITRNLLHVVAVPLKVASSYYRKV